MKNLKDIFENSLFNQDLEEALTNAFNYSKTTKDLDDVFDIIKNAIGDTLAHYEMSEKVDMMNYLEKLAKKHKLTL